MFSRGIEKQQRAVMGNPFHTFLPEGKIENHQKRYVLSNSKKYFQKIQQCDNFFCRACVISLLIIHLIIRLGLHMWCVARFGTVCTI